jgi:hypothetical protein
MLVFVCWASCGNLHSLRRIFFLVNLENKICDPASAGISEGRQIWEVHFGRLCLFIGLHAGVYDVGHVILSREFLKNKYVMQFLKAVRLGRYVFDDCVCLLGFMLVPT